MTRAQLTGGRGWASPAAAASIHRIDQRLGRLADINEAGRAPEVADANRAAWLAYKAGTGPWAPFALPAVLSVHVTGDAADSDDWYDPDAAAIWRAGGWRQTARYPDDRDEPWHGEYDPNLDTYLQEDDMFTDDDRKMLQEAHEAALWSKTRIGGTTKGPTISKALSDAATTVEWIKTRIGGTTKGTFQSVSDLLGRLVKKTGA